MEEPVDNDTIQIKNTDDAAKIEQAKAKQREKIKNKKKRQKKRRREEREKENSEKPQDEKAEEKQINDAETKDDADADEPNKRRYGVWVKHEDRIPTKTAPSSVSETLAALLADPTLSAIPEFRSPDADLDSKDDATKTAKPKSNFLRSGEVDESDSTQDDKKQHYGLRCNKCFSLLVRDEDFTYSNGKLSVSHRVLKDKNWEGLITQGNRVYCQKMHLIGYKEASTFATQTVHNANLKVDKTTFKENYLKNPDFTGSELTQNKPRFSSSMEVDPNYWKKLREYDAQFQ